MYHTEPPTDKTIREWYMKFQQSGCLCAAKRTGHLGLSAETVERVQETFRSHQGCTYRAPVGLDRNLGVSLSVDMLLSAVSVLVVAQTSSEIPEGLMNNPVYIYVNTGKP